MSAGGIDPDSDAVGFPLVIGLEGSAKRLPTESEVDLQGFCPLVAGYAGHVAALVGCNESVTSFQILQRTCNESWPRIGKSAGNRPVLRVPRLGLEPKTR